MRVKKISLFASMVVVVFLAGCGGISDPTQLADATLYVNFPDGTAFTSSSVHVTDDGAKYTVFATDDQRGEHYQDEITLVIPKGANIPYSVGSLSDPTVQVTYYEYTTGNNYAGNMAEGSCNITVNEITTTNVIGAFTARTVCRTVTDSVRTFNGGEFNATF